MSLLEPAYADTPLAAIVCGPYDERQLGLLVGWLPAETRAILARGPLSDTDIEPCGVCQALRPFRRWAGEQVDRYGLGDDPDAEVPMSKAQRRRLFSALLLDEFHHAADVPGLRLAAGEGLLCYERCLMIYRAAGWIDVPDDIRQLKGERLFARLPLPVRPRDIVTLTDGRRAVVETAHVAEDLRDAKCVVIVP